MGYLLTRMGVLFGMFAYYRFCPAWDIHQEASGFLWSVVGWVPLLWYGGAPLVALAFLTHLLSSRMGRPRIGRIVSRVIAGAILVLYGSTLLGFAVDLAVDSDCLDIWGGIEGLKFFLAPDIAPTIAALSVLAAVRIPRHRVRRILRTRLFRRTATGVALLALLSFLPVADLGSGPITAVDQCGSIDRGGRETPMGARAYLCEAHAGERFTKVPDHLALAYGRTRCAAYTGSEADRWWIAPICPKAAADVKRERDAEEAEYQAREAANQRVCDASRHRPLTKPVRVARERTRTDYGVLESYEGEEGGQFDDGLLDTVQDNGLVAGIPGHLMIRSHSDYEICLTAETYRRRPPVEVKDWNHVVEVGYESLAGSIELMDPMDGEGALPNLAFLGKGHYRVRVHYREPDWDSGTPQHILVMVYPGRSDKVIVHRRSSR